MFCQFGNIQEVSQSLTHLSELGKFYCGNKQWYVSLGTSNEWNRKHKLLCGLLLHSLHIQDLRNAGASPKYL